ncbi:MAG: transporter substrate-binding domain-containing protein [Desulfuromusa sp.]|jgi:polar amino acid transport system substrate-binding protein|nr:transporter substrate-binding domain-containing protein [Desulfuromusa sp.]
MKRMLIISFLLVSVMGTVEAAEPMKIAYMDTYPPRSWEEDGQMKGILVDVMNEVLQNRLGISLAHEGYPWARAQIMVKQGLADAFITIPTEERESYTEISQQPVLQFELFLSTSKDHPKLKELKQIKTLKELKPFKIVEYYGNGFAKKTFKGFDVEWLPEISAVYPFLASGKADVLLLSDRGIFDLNRLGYQDRIIVLPQALYQLKFHLCIGKKSPFRTILPEVDKILSQMAVDGTLKKIIDRYY